MAISQLYPTQRPALDLNFARQKRLDSRVTFTRGSTATYVGSDGLIKTAASGEARFDHDPATGESLGLLVEEARTNRRKYSNDFSSNVYVATGVTVTPNHSLSPDGSITATLVSDTATTSAHLLEGFSKTNSRFTTVTGENITCSVFVKPVQGTQYIRLLNRQVPNAFGRGYVAFDVVNKTVSSSESSYGVIPYGNGWYRIWFSFTAPGNETVSQRISFAGGTSYLGGNDSFLVFGVCVENGSFPTSYIPTTTATVTRSADVASLTNSSIYDTDSFTILNEPFGSAAGASTLSLVGAGETPIKRTAVYSQNLTQTQINASVGKTDEFWRWRILGTSFGLPNFTTDGQVTVDWGDGTVETLTTSDHTFTDGGGYHEIGFRLDSGTYFRPYINNNASHVTKVVAVGPAPESMKLAGQRAFFACTNLEAFDAAVDLSGGTDLYRAWRACTNLKSFPALDTSSITSFGGTWANCSSFTSFPLLNTATGTSFTEAWLNCTSLTSFPAIDTSSGTNLAKAWDGCSSLVSFPLINTASVTDFGEAWENCSSLTSFPLINTAAGTRFTQTWSGCSSLTSFPSIDTSSATSTNRTWRYCSSLTSFPLLDFSNSTSFEQCWNGCSSLTSFPLIDTSSGTNFGFTWNGCNSLTSFPLIDTSSGTTFYQTWNGCNSLTSFPLIDTSSGTTFYRAWYGCSSLTSFPANFFDSWTGTPANNCFVGAWDQCTSLTATSVENILNSIDTSGQSAPGSGIEITIRYDTGTGTPSITTAVTNLKSRGWTIVLNGVLQ
jgi:hypothetical protein